MGKRKIPNISQTIQNSFAPRQTATALPSALVQELFWYLIIKMHIVHCNQPTKLNNQAINNYPLKTIEVQRGRKDKLLPTTIKRSRISTSTNEYLKEWGCYEFRVQFRLLILFVIINILANILLHFHHQSMNEKDIEW